MSSRLEFKVRPWGLKDLGLFFIFERPSMDVIIHLIRLQEEEYAIKHGYPAKADNVAYSTNENLGGRYPCLAYVFFGFESPEYAQAAKVVLDKYLLGLGLKERDDSDWTIY